MFERGVPGTIYEWMFDKSTGDALTSGVTVWVSKDAGPDVPGAGALVHIGLGKWAYTFTSLELDAVSVGITFYHANTIPRGLNVITTVLNPQALDFGLLPLPLVAPGEVGGLPLLGQVGVSNPVVGNSDKTLTSSSSPYCTPAQFLDFYDLRFTSELVRDDGSEATESELQSDSRLARALGAASGMVEQACLVGERYTPDDLLAMATSNTVGGDSLRKIVATIAAGILRERRGVIEETSMPSLDKALATVERLRSGERILAFEEAANAGLPKIRDVTAAEKASQNLLTSDLQRILPRTSRGIW